MHEELSTSEVAGETDLDKGQENNPMRLANTRYKGRRVKPR